MRSSGADTEMVIPHHLDRVFFAWNYLRVDGWIVPEPDELLAVEVRFADTLLHRETRLLRLASPDIADQPACRFSLSLLLPEGVEKTEGEVAFVFRDGPSLRVPINGPDGAGMDDGLLPLFRSLLPPGARLLEIGSHERTGFDPLTLFPGAKFTRTDIAAGPGVDAVVDAHRLSETFALGSFDAICSFVVLEHLAMPWKVAVEMNRVLALGGVAYALSVQTCGLHDMPWDFFRFSDSAYRSLFNRATGFEVVETRLGTPMHVFPFVRTPFFGEAEKTAGFFSAEVVVRKIGETTLDWDVPLDVIVDQAYPHDSPGPKCALRFSLDEPADSDVPNDEPLVRVRGRVQPNAAVERIELTVDDELVGVTSALTGEAEPTFELWWNASRARPGRHEMQVRVSMGDGSSLLIRRSVLTDAAPARQAGLVERPDMTIAWARNEKRASACPACSEQSLKGVVVRVASPFTGRPPLWFLRCDRCDSVYADPFSPPPQEPRDLIRLARFPLPLQYYIEQGAGLDVMLRPLFDLPIDRIRSMVEIGCGFGFVLDFAHRELGWSVYGLEPAGWGEHGRAMLGVDVRTEFLGPGHEPERAVDCVFASEVLEHIELPLALFDFAARACSKDGILALTTPDAGRLDPALPHHDAWAILSPGHHYALFSRRAVERAAEAAGFPFTVVSTRHITLLATLSRSPIPAPPSDADRSHRTHFRSYLEKRLATLQPDSILYGGLAYRLFKEHVNSGDYELAERSLRSLSEAARARYRLDITDVASLGLESIPVLGMAEFGDRLPFYVCGALFFQGILCLNQWASPGRAALFFEACGHAARLVRSALASIGAIDGETEDLDGLAGTHVDMARRRVSSSP